MRLITAAMIFVIAFAVGAVVILTFTQDPFKVPVAAKLLFYHPPAIPIYWYVMGCFGLGLLMGLLAAVWVWVGALSRSVEHRKAIRRLEDDLAQARVTSQPVASVTAEAPQSPPPPVAG